MVNKKSITLRDCLERKEDIINSREFNETRFRDTKSRPFFITIERREFGIFGDVWYADNGEQFNARLGYEDGSLCENDYLLDGYKEGKIGEILS